MFIRAKVTDLYKVKSEKVLNAKLFDETREHSRNTE